MALMLQAHGSVLVLVDQQARMLPALAHGDEALRNALVLAQLAQALAVPCVGIEQSPAKLGPMVAELRSLCTAMVAKTHFNACAQADGGGLVPVLQPHLQAGRNQLVLAGCEAHVCLLQTALGLRALGHEVWVVADACASRTPANHALAMQRLGTAGVRLLSTEMVGFEWVGHAGHPQFKPLQELMKPLTPAATG